MGVINIVGIALDELYRCFDLLNDRYYENKLPVPVITIQKSRPNNLGHFTLDKVWKNRNDNINDSEEDCTSKYEININPVNLNRPVVNIVETLHHEMVHYANKVNGVNDCNGQIHNKKFKNLAESVDLTCEQSKKYGWGTTFTTPTFEEYVVEQIKPNDIAFEYFRLAGVPAEPKKPREKKNFKYKCPDCDLVVSAAKDKEIMCAKCKVILVMQDE